MRRRCRLDLLLVSNRFLTFEDLRLGRIDWGERHTIIIVITNHHLLDLAKLAHLAPEVLVESIKVVLQLARVHLVLRVVGGVLV